MASEKDKEFMEKARSIGVSLRRGTSEKRPVTDERDGSIGGYHTVHWDDSQDAHVLLKPVAASAKTQED